jgi:energy-coupling factor transport system ATP-binding protein
MQPFIRLTNVSFEYRISGLETLMAVSKVSMSVEKGAHVAILGKNGSGKSTLARLIGGLEMPSSGEICVDGITLSNEQSAWEIRKKCGFVFQNPDNQIIGTTVEEDVAFGPENLGMSREKMIIEIDRALRAVGLLDKKKTAPHLLSGGQKQKLAIAGIMAMNPRCFILDEATSMLDPSSRKEFMRLVGELVREHDLTVINITHNMEEAVKADYVYIMSEGAVVKEGIPRDVFEDAVFIRKMGLDVPVHMEIAGIISHLTGIGQNPFSSFTEEEARAEILRICEKARSSENLSFTDALKEPKCLVSQEEREIVVRIKDLNYTYSRETVFANDALKEVSVSIYRGELFGIVGQTGSGKSTLVQHMNGLLKPQSGEVFVMGQDLSQKKNIRQIRRKAGLLFQYPEHQLFEETVWKDIAFGPKCLGMTEQEISQAVDMAIAVVGLDASILSKSPFELSGGQKRRVAIAGIVAMRPQILILDEPAAGLDPSGREEILSFVKKLCENGTTVILVSHNMDDIARLADRVLVLQEGTQVACLTPPELFSNKKQIEGYGLSFPAITEFMLLMQKEIPELDVSVYSTYSCAKAILFAYSRRMIRL